MSFVLGNKTMPLITSLSFTHNHSIANIFLPIKMYLLGEEVLPEAD